MSEVPEAIDSEYEIEPVSSRIRIVIVDDHAMVAEGFSRIVSDEDDFLLVGVASTVSEAVTVVARERPNVVLMDFHLPDGDGAIATQKILARSPETSVIMLSGVGGHDLLARAVEAGCAGFISKDRPATDIVAAIRAAAIGGSFMRIDDLTELLGRLRNSPGDQAKFLSGRELEVLHLVAQGRSTESIAKDLYLSVHTVRNHVSNILSKLGAHSKLEAVAIATRDGIVSLDEVG